MGFLPATGFGAGAGGQMLQQIQDAQQRAAEIAQQQELARQHLLLDQQEMQQKSQLAQATLQSVNQQRQAEEQKLADARAGQATGMLTPQTVMSPTSGILKMVQGTPYESLFQPDQSLGSANISGAAGGPMNVTANPGQATGQVRYLGRPDQLQQMSQDAARGRLIASRPELADAFGALDQKEIGPAIDKLIQSQLVQPKNETEGVYNIGPNGRMVQVGTVPKGSHISNAPTPPQPVVIPLFNPQTGQQTGSGLLNKGTQQVTPLGPGIGKAPDTVTKRLGTTTSAQIADMDSALQEASRLQKILKDTGLDKDNGPIGPRWNTFLATHGISPGELPGDITQGSQFTKAELFLGLARGSGIRGQQMQQELGAHLPNSIQTGQQMSQVLNDVQREYQNKRHNMLRSHGIQDSEFPIEDRYNTGMFGGTTGTGSGGFKVVEIK